MKLLCDCHSHTLASGHAYSTVREYAEEAWKKGLRLIATTDHAPSMPGGPHMFHFHNLRVLPRSMYGVEILRGVEANILDYDGAIDMAPEDMAFLDLVIASVHLPCYKVGSRDENTRALVRAMANPRVQVIGHPDDGRIPLDYEELARQAAAAGVLLEVNNSSLLPNAYRQNAAGNYLSLLEACMRHGTRVIVNSDAHVHLDIGNFDAAWELLVRTGFPVDLVANASPERLKSMLRRA